jgi:hypothetical protein
MLVMMPKKRNTLMMAQATISGSRGPMTMSMSMSMSMSIRV